MGQLFQHRVYSPLSDENKLRRFIETDIHDMLDV